MITATGRYVAKHSAFFSDEAVYTNSFYTVRSSWWKFCVKR